MTSVPTITVPGHTTASSPRPHILYTVNVLKNNKETSVKRRYSEFVTLHDVLKDPFNLPPKRLLTTTFLPSAWADDALIEERKQGLAEYLTDLASSSKYKYHTALHQFLLGEETTTSNSLNSDGGPTRDGFDLEDALPSTLPRKAALTLAAMGLNRPTGADVVSFLAAPAAASASASDSGAIKAAAETGTTATGMHSAAYYPGWSASAMPPEKVDFSKFDILYFAFAMPNSSSGLTWEGSDKDVLRRLVTSARKSGKGTKIALSVGGWGGCYWFSQACSTASNRKKFVAALMDAVKTYDLDGIDIDWEYPNSPGAGNPYSANDAANLLALMKALRTQLGTCAILAAAVSHLPWLGSNGKPLTDVTDFAAVMTYINIMNYDVWGASGTPGPNAPMGNLCGTSKQPQASAQAALAQWKTAGFPANKQSLGLAFTKTVLSGASLPAANFLVLAKTEGKSEDDLQFLNGAHPRTKDGVVAQSAATEERAAAPAAVVAAAAATADGSDATKANGEKWFGQQIPFKTIVSSGALARKSDGTYTGSGGFTMGWDNCSNTPYLVQCFAEDYTWSLNDKAKFAKSSGMAGCFTWSCDQDDGYALQNVIRKALGKS
ncbi:glycoside hydrolase superfamily [Ephemerocybe angulata]|uniref:Glycoside hydrolase superfamily n=1 Tax=Ephemerocybe angulata TaxID=980116 RepID=A0A8H6M013_9AGAR|nr:glycoside hydrolase superfamily [Tulosesus angulatus]